MKAGVLLIVLAAAAAAAWFWLQPAGRSSGILIVDAVVRPLDAASATMTATIRNTGAPDRLLSASAAAVQAEAVGADGGTGLAVPVGTASLAVEAAHFRLTRAEPFREGELVAITFRFAGAGAVSFRARVAAPEAAMDDPHAHHPGMAEFVDVPPGQPVPSVSLDVVPDGEGWLAIIDSENFTFAEGAVDRAHVPGEGHGHIYVGGMKLGRFFENEVAIGALPRGTHTVRVTLNANDHRVLRVGGEPVIATARVSVE